MPLNKLQKEAVEYLEGPLLVLAGPGTGKTHLLSSKVKYILENTDANPENILCLTFTVWVQFWIPGIFLFPGMQAHAKRLRLLDIW